MQPPLGLFVRDQAAALSSLAEVGVLAPRLPFETWRGKGPDPQPPLTGVVEWRPSAPWWGFKGLKAAGFESRCVEYADRIESTFGVPDVIHAHTTPCGGRAGLALRKRWGSRLVITEHVGPFESMLTGARGDRIIATLMEADGVIAVSDFQRERMRAAGVSRNIDVVGNVVFEVARLCGPAADCGQIRMFSLGPPGEGKGTDILLGGLREIAGECDFRLRVGGGPVDRRWVDLAAESGLADRVEFLGTLSREQMVREFAACDVYLHASRYESFCLSVAEAMSAGRPVVITPCGGPEFFVSESSGVIAKGFSSAEFACALREWTGRRDGFDSDAIAGEIRARFSAEVIGRELMAVFDRVLRSAPAQAAVF